MTPTPESLQWPLIVALIIGLFVRLLKSERAPSFVQKIPPKARPVVAIALGAFSAPIESIVMGVSLRTAFVNGFLAAASAVLGHQVFIEWLRDGKEIAQSLPPIEVPAAERVHPTPDLKPGEDKTVNITTTVTVDRDALAQVLDAPPVTKEDKDGAS